MTARHRAAITAILITALLGIGVSGASADTWTGDTGGGPGSTATPSTPSNPDGPPGTSGGSGGASDPYRWSKTDIWWGNPAPAPAKLKAPTPIASGSKTKSTGNRCAGSNTWGKYLGLKATRTGRVAISGTQASGTWKYYMESATIECVSAPAWKIVQRRCGTQVGADVKWPIGDERAVTTTKFAPKKTPFAKSGYKNLAQCDTSFVASFEFQKPDWGVYRATATGKQRTLTVRVFTEKHAKSGKIPPTEIIGMTGDQAITANRVSWTQSCSNGHEEGEHPGRDFTAQGCLDKPSESRWTCGPALKTPPTVSGISNSKPIDIFHDAKKRPVVWNQPKPSGDLNSITGKNVTLGYVDGSPMRAGSSQAAEDQHFLAVPAFGTKVSGWAAGSKKAGKTEFVTQFFKAGMPKDNFEANTTFRFSAKFKHVRTVVAAVDFATGRLVFKTRTTWETVSAKCVSPTTNLAIVRARLSN